MNYTSPLEDDVFPRFLRHGDRRSIGQFESGLQGKKLAAPSSAASWSLRRLVLSTVSVNAILWAATIFVIWWASSH